MDQARSQLRKDMSNRLDEKFTLWQRDAVDLYDMAGLSAADCCEDMFLTLMTNLTHMVDVFGLDPKLINAGMEHALKMLEERRRRDRHATCKL